jgi:hypothetical protein
LQTPGRGKLFRACLHDNTDTDTYT